MNGNKEYYQKYENRIQAILERTPEIKGYYAFITPNHSITTIANYMKIIENFYISVNKQPSQINMDDFSFFMLKINKNQNGEETTSSFQINVYHALQSYCTYLYHADIIKKDYMQFIKRPKRIESQKTIEKRDVGFLTQDEMKTYLDGIYDYHSKWIDRDLAIVFIYLNTGMRRSALYKLDVQDIDFQNKIVIVTDKERKVLKYNLSEITLSYIRRWMFKRHKMLNGESQDALFLSSRKQRMGDQAIYYVIKKYGKYINDKNISPHKLRATYGTQLYNETKDIHFVQKAMGHSTPAVTQIYIRGDQHVAEKASDIMENILRTCEN